MTNTANTARALALILNAREHAALAALAEIGSLLLDPRAIDLYLPPVTRADISFDACAGCGEVTDTMLFDASENSLADADCEILLETSIPDGPGAGMPVGKLLAGTVLTLLEIRHPGWQDEEGSTGTAELRWQRREDGGVETQVGGTIGFRHIETTEEPFWSGGGTDAT